MTDSKFAACTIRKDWTVYGFKLRPFSLFHRHQLEWIDSPLIYGGGVREYDVLIAAQICATDKALTKYKKCPIRRLWHNPEKEFEKMLVYLSECRSSPDLYEPLESDEGKRNRWHAPGPLLVVTTLVRCTSIRWREAWHMSEGEAMWAFYSVREQEGGTSEIHSEEEQRNDAELKAQMERDRPMHLKRGRNIALRHQGHWPKDIPWDIDAELDQEHYDKLAKEDAPE